jgi:hypothetical protein
VAVWIVQYLSPHSAFLGFGGWKPFLLRYAQNPSTSLTYEDEPSPCGGGCTLLQVENDVIVGRDLLLGDGGGCHARGTFASGSG